MGIKIIRLGEAGLSMARTGSAGQGRDRLGKDYKVTKSNIRVAYCYPFLFWE